MRLISWLQIGVFWLRAKSKFVTFVMSDIGHVPCKRHLESGRVF